MTLPDCYPGDHDETGARTEQHDMDLIPVERIFEKARRERWPTSYIDAMANHHLCGGRAEWQCGTSASQPWPNGSPYPLPPYATGAADTDTSPSQTPT